MIAAFQYIVVVRKCVYSQKQSHKDTQTNTQHTQYSDCIFKDKWIDQGESQLSLYIKPHSIYLFWPVSVCACVFCSKIAIKICQNVYMYGIEWNRARLSSV